MCLDSATEVLVAVVAVEVTAYGVAIAILLLATLIANCD